jgi:hypothetical protein
MILLDIDFFSGCDDAALARGVQCRAILRPPNFALGWSSGAVLVLDDKRRAAALATRCA